jgi:hypothetical protein
MALKVEKTEFGNYEGLFYLSVPKGAPYIGV